MTLNDYDYVTHLNLQYILANLKFNKKQIIYELSFSQKSLHICSEQIEWIKNENERNDHANSHHAPIKRVQYGKQCVVFAIV